MNWQTDKAPPTDGTQIITVSWNEQTKRHEYSVVFYHAPMKLWYGGPGLVLKREDIKQWSEIEAPSK